MKSTIKHLLIGAVLAIASLAAQAATIHAPDSFLYDAVRGQIVFGTDTIKCGLAPSSYTYNRATHTKRSDVTEVTGTGYTAGGQTVTVTVTNDTTNHKLVFSLPTIVWTGSTTITARQLFCYKSTGTAANDPLFLLADFGTDQSSSGGTFTVEPINLQYTHP